MINLKKKIITVFRYRIKSILMTTQMNKDIDAGEITRVNNWIEIYDEIENYKKTI